MNKSDIQSFITQSRLAEAIDATLKLAEGTRQANEIHLLSARFHELERQKRLGIEPAADLDRTQNQIIHALLQLLDEFPDSTDATNSPIHPHSTNASGTRKSSFNAALWIGIASMAIILVAVLFLPCPSSAQFFVFRLILALGVAGIGSILPGVFNIDSGIAKANGALGLFALAYLTNPAVLIADDQCNNKPFTLTVSIHTQKPSPVYPDLKNAELWVWQGNDWKKSPISPESIADFKNLSTKLIGQRVPLQLKAEHYRLLQDSLSIQPPAVMLTLIPDGSLERVFGKVSDKRRNALQDIIVEVENLFDTTDAAGNYEIRIPVEAQKTHYQIHARDSRKRGFSPYDDEVWPASGVKSFSMKNNSQ